jgi:hypothetical protein
VHLHIVMRVGQAREQTPDGAALLEFVDTYEPFDVPKSPAD